MIYVMKILTIRFFLSACPETKTMSSQLFTNEHM